MDSRYLNFNVFLKERAAEILKFTSILQADTKKRGHQGVPKSIRRRAMSHNRYRIPLKVRRPMESDLKKAESMQKLPKCRKHIRKRQRLMLAYNDRFQKVRWLSTHIWSAKRMRMMKYHGYKVAETPNQKCFRSSYRHFRHNACLMDFSYLHELIINIKSSTIPPNIKTNIQSPTTQSLYEGQLYHQEILVCPLLIVFETQTILHCYYHPACHSQIDQIIWDDCYDVKNMPSKSQIYLVIGPKSIDIIRQALENCGKTLGQGQSYPELTLTTKDSLIGYFKGCEGKVRRDPFVSEPHQQMIKSGYNPQQNEAIRERVMNRKQPLPHQSDWFWQFYANQKDEDITFNITTRSKYTHKRKNKLTKSEKKQLIQSDTKEKKQQKIIQITQKQPSYQPSQVDPFMIASFSKNSLFRGSFLFCSRNHNCKIWRSLTKSNIKVIGRHQYRQCLLESGVRCFPEDYPNTKAFHQYNMDRSVQLIKKYKRLPPQKRQNYERILSPHPFLFKTTNYFRSVSLEMVGRGRCFEGSYLCRLQKEDLPVITQMIEGNTLRSVLSQKKEKHQNKISYKSDSCQQINKKLSEVGCGREVIGFVTSGGYLFHRSREGGIGYLLVELDVEYVLVRKPSSTHYFLASVGCL